MRLRTGFQNIWNQKPGGEGKEVEGTPIKCVSLSYEENGTHNFHLI